MARGYIEISTDGGTTYKSYDVEAYTGRERGRNTPIDLKRTLDGSASLSIGVSKRTYNYTLVVQYTGASTGYGTIDDLATALTSSAGGDVAWYLKPMENTTAVQVVCTSFDAFDPEPLTPSPFDTTARFKVPISMLAV